MHAGASSQVLGELLGLLAMQAQKERHGDCPQPDAATHRPVANGIAEADSFNHLSKVFQVLHRLQPT